MENYYYSCEYSVDCGFSKRPFQFSSNTNNKTKNKNWKHTNWNVFTLNQILGFS